MTTVKILCKDVKYGIILFVSNNLWDMNNTKWCNDFYIKFRQSFTKETFSYDKRLKILEYSILKTGSART